MEVRDLGLDGVKEITPARFGDARGFFSETYNEQRFVDAGLPTGWVQDNHSLSADAFCAARFAFPNRSILRKTNWFGY